MERVRGKQRDEGVEVEPDEPDAGDDHEHGTNLPVAPGKYQAFPGTGENGGAASVLNGEELALPHREQRCENRDEAERVDDEAHADARGSDQDARDGRADHA